MIKIEFPADRTDIAAAIGRALLEVAVPHLKKEKEPVYVQQAGRGERQEAAPLVAEGRAVPAVSPEQPTAFVEKPDAPPPTPMADVEVSAGPEQDTNGVPFDPNYCSKSDQPFYTSGKQLGCWKKRRGLDQAEYDAWYASQLQPAAPVVEEQQAPVDVAAALTGQASSLFPDEQPADGPKTAGELMVWVSEQQVAGHITQEDVQAAYQAAGCQNPGMLFADEAAYVGPIHAHLADKVSA